jgi:hypothetical protein
MTLLPNVHILVTVHGGTARCQALQNLLSFNAIMFRNQDLAVAAIRDAIGLAQITIQPETRCPSLAEVGKATVIVMVDDLPHAGITIRRDNTVICFGDIDWQGGKAEWEKHRSGPSLWRDQEGA